MDHNMTRENAPAQEFDLHAFQWMGEKLPGGFFVYLANETHEIIYANQVLLKLYGCKDLAEFKELSKDTFLELVHSEDRNLVLKKIEQQIANKENENLDHVVYRIIRRDGEIRWVDDYGRFATIPHYGDVYYVFIADITKEKLSQEEILHKKEVIEGLSIDFNSIFLVDFDTGIMTVHRSHSSYFDAIEQEFTTKDQHQSSFSMIDFLTKYAKKFIIVEDQKRFLEQVDPEVLKSRLVNEHNFNFNYRIYDDHDQIRYMSLSAAAIHEGDRIARMVLGFRDVTTQTEEMQKQLADHMKVQLELEEEKHANEIKSSFLFNISHDIRTPMNAIMGFSELAKRHINDPELLKDFLNDVEESSRHMLNLIDDLLEMSNLGYGRIEIKNAPANLAKEIQETVDMFKLQLEEKEQELELDLKIPDYDVLVDAHRLRRVLGNLISNAIKFTPNGGNIKVKALEKQKSKTGYVRYEFAVSDNGIGMSEDFIHKIYQAFEREQSSTQSCSTGTGLGLPITKSLLDIMGGSIHVESKKGEGTTFTVNIPLKLVDQAKSDAPIVVEKEYKSNGEKRILLVEDILINRRLAETILKEAGFLVDSVVDGCDAVDAINNHPLYYYDLILMDIQMPVMNGYEATRAIRALKREDTATLPIIALSANARDEDKKMSLESGMNSHVAKPFNIAQLVSTINSHIAARHK